MAARSSKPEAYRVRARDLAALVRELNHVSTSAGDLYDAARTLVGWAEPIGTGDWTCEAYGTLVGPWTSVVGKVHPDD